MSYSEITKLGLHFFFFLVGEFLYSVLYSFSFNKYAETLNIFKSCYQFVVLQLEWRHSQKSQRQIGELACSYTTVHSNTLSYVPFNVNVFFSQLNVIYKFVQNIDDESCLMLIIIIIAF